jgi:hypothetical protein
LIVKEIHETAAARRGIVDSLEGLSTGRTGWN